MRDALNRIAGEAPLITTFGDAELVTGYDIVLRVRLVLALQKIRHRLDKIHVYSRSKVVVTAMRAANLVLGNVMAHGSRQSFEAALAKVVAERTRGP